MTVKECYIRIGGNYADAERRFSDADRIVKFLKMFLNDDSFSNLETAIARHDYAQAFAAAHTLKGILLNMSFDRVSVICCELVEKLRVDEKTESEILSCFQALKTEYEFTVTQIKILLAEEVAQ